MAFAIAEEPSPKKPVVVLNLDLDDTLFEHNKDGKSVWRGGAHLWQIKMSSWIAHYAKHGVILALNIITAKGGFDPRVQMAVDNFAEFLHPRTADGLARPVDYGEKRHGVHFTYNWACVAEREEQKAWVEACVEIIVENFYLSKNEKEKQAHIARVSKSIKDTFDEIHAAVSWESMFTPHGALPIEKLVGIPLLPPVHFTFFNGGIGEEEAAIPYPDKVVIMLEQCRFLNIPPENVILVDDDPTHTGAAAAAGFQTISAEKEPGSFIPELDRVLIAVLDRIIVGVKEKPFAFYTPPDAGVATATGVTAAAGGGCGAPSMLSGGLR